MSENKGWIKLHRKLLNNPIINKPNYLALWIILLLKAGHNDNYFIFNGKKRKCSAGQFLTGRKKLSEESKINESLVERILKYLENEQQIEQQKTNKFRLITIKNWAHYQNSEQQNEQQMNNKRTTNEQQMNTIKNIKNIKNEKNFNILPSEDGGKEKKETHKNIILIMDIFKKINPTINYGNKTNRNAIEALIKQFDLERVIKFAEYACEIQGMPYSPVITTPYMLKEKLAQLQIYYKKLQNNSRTVFIS